METNIPVLVTASADGKDITTSRIVAEIFGKLHKNVLQDIRELSCSDEFRRLNFQLSVEIRKLPQGGAQKLEYYEMTRNGFSFLAMGYTGELPLSMHELRKRLTDTRYEPYIPSQQHGRHNSLKVAGFGRCYAYRYTQYGTDILVGDAAVTVS